MFCLRNIQDKIGRQKVTENERRYGTPIIGPSVPFGIGFVHRVCAKDKNGLHQFGKKINPSDTLLVVEEVGQETGPKRSDSGQEEGGVADVSAADRDVMEAREDFWRMLGAFIYRHNVMCREQLYAPTASSFPIPLNKCIDVVRETKKNNLDHLEESIMDVLWNIDGRSQKVGADPRDFPILNKRSPQGLLLGGWKIDQDTSHIATRSHVASSVVINVQMCSKRKESSNGTWSNSTFKLHVRRGPTVHDIPTNLDNLAPLLRTPEEAGDSIGTSHAMRKTNSHPDRQGTDAESCSVKRRREKTSAH